MPTPRSTRPPRFVWLPVLLLPLLAFCDACDVAGKIEDAPVSQMIPGDPTLSPEEDPFSMSNPPPPLQMPPAPAGLRAVAAWEELFLKSWGNTHTRDFLPWSRSHDSWDFYNLAYGIDANTAMFRATGRKQYMDRALLYANGLMASATRSAWLPNSKFKDGYLGWASERSEPAGQEVPLYESYCWRYVTRMLRALRDSPELYDNGIYRSQYDRLLAFSEKNIFEKWYVRGANDFIYRNRTHMAAHWAFIAMDLARMTTDPENRARYVEVFNNINQGMPNFAASLRGQMKANPDHPTAYFWDAVWGSTAQPGQDVAHANGVIAFIVEAHEAGQVWTDTDIRRFVVTMNTVIWPSQRAYAAYVDGSGVGDGWFNDGMMKLGRYDVELQRRLENHMAGQNSQFYANGALNVRLLSERTAHQASP
jgi:hypothetical protein